MSVGNQVAAAPRRQRWKRSCTSWLAALAEHPLRGLLVAGLASACEPKLVVGTWPAAAGSSSSCGVIEGEGGAPSTGPVLDPVAVPWSTGFENEFCDYLEAKGYCYVDGDASYEIVTGPAHSGQNSASFSVNSEAGRAQTRCIRRGTLPKDAYYGAWFNLGAPAEATGLWNLMFFQGGGDGALEPLWDVSVGNAEGGGHALFIFGHQGAGVLMTAGAPEVPIGSWFHVEFRLLRAADETGLVALYQDGVLIHETQQIATDDTSWAQWYVGNLVENRTPPDSTVYVDDVSIRAAP